METMAHFGDLCMKGEPRNGESMSIKMIAMDMDGTFLDDDKNIPAENIEAVRACADRGIEIVPATGRTLLGLPDEVKNMPGVRYAITVNGAVVVDLKEDKVINTCKLDSKLAVRIMELARDSEDDIMYDAYVDGIGYTTENFRKRFDYYVQTPVLVELLKKTRKVVNDTIEYVCDGEKEVEKINFFFRDEQARQRMRKLLETIPEVIATSAIPSNLEINAKGADKGSALLRLAEHLGIRQEETMAFGDGGNDVTMIKKAGIGVAMENGYESVKAEADHITASNNEAGVAKAIRQFALK